MKLLSNLSIFLLGFIACFVVVGGITPSKVETVPIIHELCPENIVYTDTVDLFFSTLAKMLDEVETKSVQDPALGDYRVIGNDTVPMARGRWQIWNHYVKDSGTGYTHREMHDSTKAYHTMFNWNLRYMKSFVKTEGRYPTWQEMARCHNGGPRGYRRNSTLKYLKKTYKYLPKSGMTCLDENFRIIN